ncbi:MAG: hypothetical protein H7145_21535 [Akkermansiaceae bacterium]|nr:hypothetical protein [Armatimonadota bacterium]
MQQQRTEEETEEVYKPFARETDTENHPQTEHTGSHSLGDLATKMNSVPVGYRIGEALSVTIGLAVVTTISRLAFSVLIGTFATNFLTSPENLPQFIGVVSFVTTAVASIAIGVLVGFMANRRTMVGSLTVANVITAIGWQIFMTITYPQFFDPSVQLMPQMLLSSLFGLLTITLTDIAVALYVARKLRKKA